MVSDTMSNREESVEEGCFAEKAKRFSACSTLNLDESEGEEKSCKVWTGYLE